MFSENPLSRVLGGQKKLNDKGQACWVRRTTKEVSYVSWQSKTHDESIVAKTREVFCVKWLGVQGVVG